jgi:hypothetical protein
MDSSLETALCCCAVACYVLCGLRLKALAHKKQERPTVLQTMPNATDALHCAVLCCATDQGLGRQEAEADCHAAAAAAVP